MGKKHSGVWYIIGSIAVMAATVCLLPNIQKKIEDEIYCRIR